MFSKELESLIQATLEDGKLEDYEKAALVKRAQAEGVDLAELEIYINSILQRREREANHKKEAKERTLNKQKKEAFGRVCPNCGAQVLPMAIKCECGYEFTTNHQISSVQILFEKIEKILEKPLPNDAEKRKEAIENRDQQIREIISVFPVPNSKEDIIEFLSLSLPKSRRKGGFLGSMMNRFLIVAIITIIIVVVCVIKAINADEDDMTWPILGIFYLGGGAAVAGSLLAKKVDIETIRWNKDADVWRAKYEQVLIKGRSMRGDSDFIKQLDYYEKLLKK